MEVVLFVDPFKDFYLLQLIFFLAMRVEPDVAVCIRRMKGFDMEGEARGHEVFCRDEVGGCCVGERGIFEGGSDGTMARNEDVFAKKVCPLLDKFR